MLAIAVTLGVLAAGGPRLETSVLAMLPEAERDPVLHELSSRISSRSARTLLVLVGHPDRERATEAAAWVEGLLRGDPEFSEISGALDAESERAFFELYFPHHLGLLPPGLRAELESGAGPEELVQRVRERLYGPLSSMYGGLLERDPLLLYPEFVQSLSGARGAGFAGEGWLVFESGGRSYAVIAAQTSADPFAADGQAAALERIESLRASLAESVPGTELLYTGVPRFAAHTRSGMKRDVGVIGIGSMIGTLLCILLAFRSLRPFWLSILPVAVGIGAATTACLLAFDDLHALTLVFGTSLTGLGVDYALHYFAAHRMAGERWDPREGMRAILPGITLGLVTSVVGFSGLWFTHFPVLRQFALFSSVGLAAAWATVVCWFPPLLARPHRARRPPRAIAACQAFLDGWRGLQRRRAYPVFLVLAGAISAGGCLLPEYDDDVRSFQSEAPALAAEDARVREIAGRAEDSRFVLVEGADEQQVLERLEGLRPLFSAAEDAGEIAGARELSLFLPSLARQRADRELLAKALLPRFDELRAGLEEIGYAPEVVEGLRARLSSAGGGGLDVGAWLSSPASRWMRALWLGTSERGAAATVLLSGVADGAALERRLAGLPGVRYVDRVRDLSGLLRRYRIDTTRLVLIAYVGVLMALVARFGPAAGWRAMLPSLLAAGTTLAALAACGVRLDLFHLLGLLLVLAIAVDYGVFFAENALAEATTLFALALSVVTTVTAFGLMVSSSAPPLESLGASVSLGLVLALLFSPMARRRLPAEGASTA